MSQDPYQAPPTPPPFPPHPPSERLGDNAGIRMLLPVGRSGLAIAAGYLGLISLVIVPGPVALAISLMAIRDINKSKRTATPKHGMGRAIFGLAMGGIATLVLLLVLARGTFANEFRFLRR